MKYFDFRKRFLASKNSTQKKTSSRQLLIRLMVFLSGSKSDELVNTRSLGEFLMFRTTETWSSQTVEQSVKYRIMFNSLRDWR